jgi:hypothetical protein
MAANAINTSDINVDEAEAITPTEVEYVTEEETVAENPVKDFNPNDIRIEDVDEVEINQLDDKGTIAEVEPEPITLENQYDIILDGRITDNPEENGGFVEPYIEPQYDIIHDDIHDDIIDDIISGDLV